MNESDNACSPQMQKYIKGLEWEYIKKLLLYLFVMTSI